MNVICPRCGKLFDSPIANPICGDCMIEQERTEAVEEEKDSLAK